MKSLIKCILGLFFINAAYAPLDPDSVRNEVAPISVRWIDHGDGFEKPVITCITNFCDAEIVKLPNLDLDLRPNDIPNYIFITCPLVFGGRITFATRNPSPITSDSVISEIQQAGFQANRTCICLQLPDSETHLICIVVAPSEIPESNEIGMYKHKQLNKTFIIQRSPNLLEFIQQVSKDGEFKAKVENWAHVPIRSGCSWFTIPEGSIPLNHNPLLTILSRPEFKTKEFHEFANHLFKNIGLPPLNKKCNKIKGTVMHEIATFVFGDINAFLSAGSLKTFSDAPEYASLAKLMSQNITLITLDQQASSSSSQTPI